MSRSTAKEGGGACRERCDRREEILDAATALFAEDGFSDTVTQLLADKLQVGKGTLYRYFPSKRELFLAAADRVMRLMHERIEARIRGVDEPMQRIACAVTELLGFFHDHPGFVELLMQERAQFKDRDKPTFLEHRARIIERWRELYRSLIAQGRVRELPVERITDVLAAMMYGSLFLNYAAGHTRAFANQAEDILDIFFHGIVTDAERHRAGPDAVGGPPDDANRYGRGHSV